MKLKEGFVLKEIAGECVVVSVNTNLDLRGVITLNCTAKTLWLALDKGVDSMDELVTALTNEYDVTKEHAKASACKFVEKLKELDLLA